MDLEQVADELYSVLPEDFVETRKERQTEARAAGDKALAKAIGELAKPTSAAWVCNLAVRLRHDEVAGLVELGAQLREAQQNLVGEDLRALNRQRMQLLSALTRQAATLAREHGHRVSSSVAGQVEDTLRAAMVDPDAGQALLTGRLVQPMATSGFGTVTGRPDLRLVPPHQEKTTPARSRATPSPATAAPRPTPVPRRRAGEKQRADEQRRAEEQRADEQRAEEQRQAAERRRQELAEARHAAERATADAEEARATAEEEAHRVAELTARRDELADQVAQLHAQLRQTERAADEARTELAQAQQRTSSAERDAAAAEKARDRAAARVESLADGD